MLKFLQMLDAFHALMGSGDFKKSVTRCASEKLEHEKFDPKFNGRFAIALFSIVDAFLKHGKTFKSQLKQLHVISPPRILSEWDIFISAHHHNLFGGWWVGTPWTVGLSHEAEFLDAIASVVGEENLDNARKLLADMIEWLKPAAPDFAHIAFHASCISKSARDGHIAAIPRAYEATSRRNMVLSKRDSR
jgi:hypothetical protein